MQARPQAMEGLHIAEAVRRPPLRLACVQGQGDGRSGELVIEGTANVQDREEDLGSFQRKPTARASAEGGGIDMPLRATAARTSGGP